MGKPLTSPHKVCYNIKIEKVIDLLQGLTKQGYYGNVTINYENGKITYVGKYKTLKEELC